MMPKTGIVGYDILAWPAKLNQARSSNQADSGPVNAVNASS